MLDLLQPSQIWLTKLDSRTKLLMFLAYAFAVLSTKPQMHIAWIALAVLLAMMFFVARIPIGWALRRFIPILPFVGLGAIGLLFGGSRETFIQVTVKMLLCVGAAIWLSATTPFNQLLEGLRKLKVPTLLTIMLSFMFRYLFVLAEESIRMSRAYQSRCPRKQTLKDAANIGKLAGALMLRTYGRAERIYLAMLSRGFDGEFRTISVQRMTSADFALLIAFIVSLVLIVISLR
ncbi:MAG: cobalt ECF transporter T component CbiQ [Armatimonadetes bacterium]|nr:cobalt ECF transporter T component CbiQ [Armatimonadota bacterium]MDW8029633.1 cobalt ECF transporter T component CbiQ [Armatimonadota bacterium]